MTRNTFFAVSTTLLLATLFAGPAAASAETAQDVVGRFYKSYQAYLARVANKTRSPRKAQNQTEAVTRPFLTSRFQAAQAKLAKYCGASHADVPEECDGDPFLCAQEPPTWFRVVDSDATSVGVELCFNCEAAELARCPGIGRDSTVSVRRYRPSKDLRSNPRHPA